LLHFFGHENLQHEYYVIVFLNPFFVVEIGMFIKRDNWDHWDKIAEKAVCKIFVQYGTVF